MNEQKNTYMKLVRFQLASVTVGEEYIWVRLDEIRFIKEYSLADGARFSTIYMHGSYSYEVMGWAGEQLVALQKELT